MACISGISNDCEITENCKDCENYNSGGCYYGLKLLVRIFGPLIVPENGWCNRFDQKTR